MAARGGGGDDGRTMTQEEHLLPWLQRVDNKGTGFTTPALGKETALVKEARPKELPVFELLPVHISANPKITKINGTIVSKVNALAEQRQEYFLARDTGAPVKERNMLARNIQNLLSQIQRFQSAVTTLGGVYFPTPAEFDDVKDL